MAAVLLLRGIDPHPALTCDDRVEAAVLARALERATELRQQEFEFLARTIRNEIAQALSG